VRMEPGCARAAACLAAPQRASSTCGLRACASCAGPAQGPVSGDDLAYSKKPRPVDYQPYKMVRVGRRGRGLAAAAQSAHSACFSSWRCSAGLVSTALPASRAAPPPPPHTHSQTDYEAANYDVKKAKGYWQLGCLGPEESQELQAKVCACVACMCGDALRAGAGCHMRAPVCFPDHDRSARRVSACGR
jgi:hypothetical protein